MNAFQWFELLVSLGLQVSLVIGVAWILERWTCAARTKTRIWTACAVSLLGLVAAGLLLPRLRWCDPWSQLGPRQLMLVVDAQHVIGSSLAVIWMFGIGVMLTRWSLRALGMRRFLATCPRLNDHEERTVRAVAGAESLRLGPREVEFRICPPTLGPFCYQLHQPIVCLPRSLVEGDAAELRHVLQHELAHLQTRHPLQLFGHQLTQAVLWFHPLVWISSRRASLAREFVCDDAATADGRSTASYLRTLLRIVELQSLSASGTMSIGQSPSELRLRAGRLVTQDHRAVPRSSGWSIAGVFAVAILASQMWLPTDPLASPNERFSPWPNWSAAVLHTLDLSVRDFEPFDGKLRVHELWEERHEQEGSS